LENKPLDFTEIILLMQAEKKEGL